MSRVITVAQQKGGTGTAMLAATIMGANVLLNR